MDAIMNPKIKELLERIRSRPNDAPLPTEYMLDECASILQAVFDPENQPSQYGTTLVPKT